MHFFTITGAYSQAINTGTTKHIIRTFQQMYVYMHLFTFSGPSLLVVRILNPASHYFDHILPPLTEDDHIRLFEPCFIVPVVSVEK